MKNNIRVLSHIHFQTPTINGTELLPHWKFIMPCARITLYAFKVIKHGMIFLASFIKIHSEIVINNRDSPHHSTANFSLKKSA